MHNGLSQTGDYPKERSSSAPAPSQPGPDQERLVLRLYVAGNAPNSVRALANVWRICQEYLPGCFELEVVDIYQQPSLAQKAQLVAVPTLIRRSPPPLRRITGDLSSVEQLLVDLEPTSASASESGS